MNHCLLEVEVLEAPQVRYTQDNQTPVAEMLVRFDGLRVDDPPGQIKAVGWGSVAQDLQNRVVAGQRLVLEGRLRMNTLTRQDGIKEKRAEITVSRLHPLQGGDGGRSSTLSPAEASASLAPASSGTPARSGSSAAPVRRQAAPAAANRTAPAAAPTQAAAAEAAVPVWNAAPLVPDPEGYSDPLDDDDIPF